MEHCDAMKLTKDAIVSHLHRNGKHDEAVRADSELEDRLHSIQDLEILQQYGIDEGDIDEIARREPQFD